MSLGENFRNLNDVFAPLGDFFFLHHGVLHRYITSRPVPLLITLSFLRKQCTNEQRLIIDIGLKIELYLSTQVLPKQE